MRKTSYYITFAAVAFVLILVRFNFLSQPLTSNTVGFPSRTSSQLAGLTGTHYIIRWALHNCISSVL